MNRISQSPVKLTTNIFLILLVLSAFLLRVKNSYNPVMVSVDENVYFHLGRNLSQDISDYSAAKYADVLLSQQPDLAPLPSYFYSPLFKHPPLFSFLVASSIRVFGDFFQAGVYVSAFFGSMMILLGYLLGKLFFDRKIGLWVAVFLWLDPINTICSQKVWMDSTLAFFTVLAILFYAYGLRKKQDYFFILGGLSCGMAVLTKYPGILPALILVLYAVIYHRALLKNRLFILSLALPLIMLIPWIVWNLQVSGIASFSSNSEIVHLVGKGLKYVFFPVLFLSIVFMLFKDRLVKQKTMTKNEEEQDDRLQGVRRKLVYIIGGLLVAAASRAILDSLTVTALPAVSWGRGRLIEPLFYFRQLIKFNFIYLLAFCSFFFYGSKRHVNAALLNLSCFGILLFYLLWGNGQSRYILALTPFLLIVGTAFVFEILEKIQELNVHPIIKKALAGCVMAVIMITIVKTICINFVISYPNDLCYF